MEKPKKNQGVTKKQGTGHGGPNAHAALASRFAAVAATLEAGAHAAESAGRPLDARRQRQLAVDARGCAAAHLAAQSAANGPAREAS